MRLPPLPLLLGLLAVALLWWLVPATIRSFWRTSFWEFQAPAWTLTGTVADLEQYWAARVRPTDELLEQGRDLARQLAATEVELQQAQARQAEIARLEQLLRLPPQPGYRFEIARVVRRDLSAWWHLLTIRKGSDHGLRPGQGVIFAGGVAGRVKEVFAQTATVELLSSPGFRMAATIAGDGRPVIYQGTATLAFAVPQGTVNTVPPELRASAVAPQRLVSTALGGVFPDGLSIGRIERLALAGDGLFQSGEVLLDERLAHLREVAVLVPNAP